MNDVLGRSCTHFCVGNVDCSIIGCHSHPLTSVEVSSSNMGHIFTFFARTHLNECLLNCWTGWVGQAHSLLMKWLAGSPDLTPCELFLSGHIKDLLCLHLPSHQGIKLTHFGSSCLFYNGLAGTGLARDGLQNRFPCNRRATHQVTELPHKL